MAYSAANPLLAALEQLREQRKVLDEQQKVLDEAIAALERGIQGVPTDTAPAAPGMVPMIKPLIAPTYRIPIRARPLAVTFGEGETIPGAAMKLIAAASRPMSNREIADGLAAGGFPMNSKDPVNTVGSVLRRFEQERGDLIRREGLWHLKHQ